MGMATGRTKCEQKHPTSQCQARQKDLSTSTNRSLQVVAADCDKAFQAFFRRVKNDETPGYPRFKGRHRFHSIGFKEYGNGFRMAGRRLRVSGVGSFPARSRRCGSPTRQGVGMPVSPLKCQSQPSCQKLSDGLAWMSGYPHGSRPAQVRRFKTPTPTGRAKRNCVFCNVH